MIAPYLTREHPIRMAHRGSRLLWPENTMEAFRGAVALGYRYIETDVRISADGHVIVFHDDTLERTTNGTGKVVDRSLDGLRRLDAGYHFDAAGGFPMRGKGVGISTLGEVLAEFPDVHFNIDLKGPAMEWAVADVVRAAGREASTLIASFIGRRTARFRRITRSRVATAAGPSDALAMWLASRRGRSIRRPVAAYQLPFDNPVLPIDQKLIDAIHAAGAHAHFWTVNAPAHMHRLLDMGADGIITDRPDILNDVLAARQQR